MTVLIVILAIVLFVKLTDLIYSRYWNAGLKFSINFSRRTAFEGEPLELTEVLSNAAVLPLPWVAVKFRISRDLLFSDTRNAQISDDYYRSDVFSVMMFQKITRRLPFVCGKRGFYIVKNIDLVSGNLLLNHKLIAHINCGESLTVYPRLIEPRELSVPYKKITGELLARRFIQADPFEFKGIREYQPYDSFRSINFKATAKAGRFMVNVNDSTISQEIIAVLNLQPYASWFGDTLFEQAIRMAASLASRCVKDGVPFRMVSNGRDIITGREIDIHSGSGGEHLANIYKALARIDLSKEVKPIAPWLNEQTQDAVYFLISTYQDSDLAEAFNQVRTRAFGVWVIPAFRETAVKVPLDDFVRKWEVADNEQGPLFD
ncbi:MAG: DUF58 domain-containing protein [Clostridiales bacterium]|nr:DUF58 domain-containing protein [Clostridiales bacterium]